MEDNNRAKWESTAGGESRQCNSELLARRLMQLGQTCCQRKVKMSAVWTYFKLESKGSATVTCDLCNLGIWCGGQEQAAFKTTNQTPHQNKHPAKYPKFTGITRCLWSGTWDFAVSWSCLLVTALSLVYSSTYSKSAPRHFCVTVAK